MSQLPIGFGGEWTQITTAKPRISKTSGYPEVVYACGEYDTIGRDFTTLLEGDLCQKSLDGGQTWITAGQNLFGSPVNTHPQCAGQTEHPNPNSGYQPSKLYMTTSRNGGRTWSRALPVLAPGVQGSRTHFGFDVGAPGHVAISYLGHRAGRNWFDGYITETYNALAKRPLFWSATVNSPSQPPLDFNEKG